MQTSPQQFAVIRNYEFMCTFSNQDVYETAYKGKSKAGAQTKFQQVKPFFLHNFNRSVV